MSVHKLETFSLGSTNRQPFMEEVDWSLAWHSGFTAGTFTFEVTGENKGPSKRVTIEMLYDEHTQQYAGEGQATDGNTYSVIGKRELVEVGEVLFYHFFVGLCTAGKFTEDDDVDGFTAIDQGPGDLPPKRRRKRKFFGLL